MAGHKRNRECGSINVHFTSSGNGAILDWINKCLGVQVNNTYLPCSGSTCEK